jgi:hypothetical protein
MANIILDAAKSSGVSSTVVLNTGDQIVLQNFDLSEAEKVFVNEAGQLVIVLQDGTQFFITNFVANLTANPDAIIIIDETGQGISFADLVAQYIDNGGEEEVEPALGATDAPQSSGTSSGGSDAALNNDLSASNSGISALDTSSPTFFNAPSSSSPTPAPSSSVTGSNVAPSSNNGSVTGFEDTNFSLGIATPTDIDGDALTITITSLPDSSAGVVQLNGVNITVGQVLTNAELTSLTFAPTANYNGTVALDYNVSDTSNATSSSRHEITVSAVQDAPVFSGTSNMTINEDASSTALNMTIPTDADTPYGDVLSINITTALSAIEGVITLDGTAITQSQTFTTAELARLQITPNANYNGSFVINYSATDSANNTVSSSHTVNVTAVNDAPTTTASSSTQAEDSAQVDLNITSPTDVDGDTVTVTLNALPTDGTLYYADGTTPVGASDVLTVAQLTTLKFTPNADFNGSVAITYTATDGTLTSSATHTITVTAVNDAPVATASSSTQDEDTTEVTLNITLPTDIDDTTLVARIDTLPTDGTLKFANGTTVVAGVDFDSAELATLTFTPAANYNGTVAINYTVEDAGGLTANATHTITVNAVNDAPTTTASTSNQDEDTTLVDVGIFAPTDVDGDTLSATINALPTDGTLYYADGTTPVGASDTLTVAQLTTLKFTPNANYNGSVVINYTVTDGTLSTAGTHTLTVNSVEDRPVTTSSTSSQDEDSSATTLGINLPTDGDGDTMYATIATLPTEGTLTFADGSAVPQNTQFLSTELAGIKFTPNANYNGTVVINYTVTDNHTAPVAGTHTVTVGSVIDAPVATNSTSTQDEDSSQVDLNITAPTDGDNDVLSITLDALPTDGTLYYADGTTPVGASDTLTVAQLTTLKFTPNANYNGSVVINYTVTDGDALTADATASHTITVTSINDAPVTTDSTSMQLEDSVDRMIVLPTPTDVEGDFMQFSITSFSDGTLKLANGTIMTVGTLYPASELGGVTFTPNKDYNGTVTIKYAVTDGTDTTNATHTITVVGENDAPVVTDSSSTQDEDSVSVALNIPKPTDPENDALTVITSLPANGTLYYADGTTAVGNGDELTVDQLAGLRFTPDANFNGTIAITYTVDDGGLITNGTHTVTVTSINDAPVVTDSSSIQDEDTSNIALNIPTPTDADGDALRFTFGTLPTEGTLTFGDGSAVAAGVSYQISDISTIRFTPNPDYYGTVELNYTVTDGIEPVEGTHTITVNPINVAPVANDSSSTQNEDTSASLGIPAPTDADGDTLFVTIDTLPTNGTLYFANGSPVPTGIQFSANEISGFTFTPSANYHGTTSFGYTVTDGEFTDSATHTINVTSIPDPIVTSASALEDNINHLNFDSVLRAAERYDCVVNGRFQIDAEYQYNTLIAGSSFYYDLPSAAFSSTDGTALNYSGTYTYNGTTHNLGDWISINSSTGDLSGYFPSSLNGLVTFNITATTVDGLSSTKSITYNIMSQAAFNDIDVIGPRYGNYLLPENTSNNLMVGVDDAGVLRYDILTTGTGITADLIKGYVNKQNGYTDLIDNYNTIYGTSHNDTFTASDAYNNIIAGGGYDILNVYAQNQSDNGHIYVSGGSLNISGIEEISMENGKTNETLHINSSSLLSQSGSGYIRINGDVYNTASDDNVQFSDKSAAQISSAAAGTTNSGGINYNVYNFATGTVYIETGLDILDAAGNQVI